MTESSVPLLRPSGPRTAPGSALRGVDEELPGRLLDNHAHHVLARKEGCSRAGWRRPCSSSRHPGAAGPVEELSQAAVRREEISERLRGVLDVERLLGRLRWGRECRANLAGLRASLREMPDLAASLEGCSALCCGAGPGCARWRSWPTCSSGRWSMKSRRVASLVSCARAFAPTSISWWNWRRRPRGDRGDGGGEKQRTGIQSLKVRYNRVFGFYIEVTKANLAPRPQDYQRSLSTGCGAIVTPPLSDKKPALLSADSGRAALEHRSSRS